MRNWLRDHGLLLANVLLFVAFFFGMTATGYRVSNNEQLEHGQSAGPSAAISRAETSSRPLRELGERVPADGRVRRADGVSLPARLVRVEDRSTSTAPQDEDPRRTRTTPTRRGRCGAAASGSCCTRTRWPSLFFLLFLGVDRSARRRRRRGVQRGARQPRRARGDTSAVRRHARSSGSSRSRTGRASSSRSSRSSCLRSTCGSAARRSRSRWLNRTRQPGPDAGRSAPWTVCSRECAT